MRAHPYQPTVPLPQHLWHRPFYALPYQPFDPDPEQTDVRYLTVGLAQWDDHEVAVKVLRHTGTRWTRESEELPLHRAADAVLWTAMVLGRLRHQGEILVEPGTFLHQDQAFTVRMEDQRDRRERAKFDAWIEGEQHRLARDRLGRLAEYLDRIRRDGRL